VNGCPNDLAAMYGSQNEEFHRTLAYMNVRVSAAKNRRGSCRCESSNGLRGHCEIRKPERQVPLRFRFHEWLTG